MQESQQPNLPHFSQLKQPCPQALDVPSLVLPAAAQIPADLNAAAQGSAALQSGSARHTALQTVLHNTQLVADAHTALNSAAQHRAGLRRTHSPADSAPHHECIVSVYRQRLMFEECAFWPECFCPAPNYGNDPSQWS